MTTNTLTTKSLLWLVFSLALLLASCSKEDRFENWLTKKDGNWEITEMSERSIGFSGNDSISTQVEASDLIGNFQFTEDDSFSYSFQSAILNFEISGSGERLTEGASFAHVSELQSLTEDIIKSQVYGERQSARKLKILMRLEWWDLNGRYLAEQFDMLLERAD